ncbi:MAG TPA: endonuclease domain-containing protein, partial [Saprospiraceae bacterium]|nr:endonuclease domain-containing protein [Saprospiraceae bacterium]
NNQLGVHFRRQHPMIDFSVDFYCHEVELVVEVDGSVHLEPTVQLEDATKQLSLEAVGITVIRFTNTDVIERMEKVLTEIKSEIERLKWIQGQNT